MRTSNFVNAVDVWLAGGPHRIVVGGLPTIKGRTMAEKCSYLSDNSPHLPAALTRGPDDPDAMVAAILTEPVDPKADFGVIWMGSGELIDMCGTGTLAVGLALAELGMVRAAAGAAEVLLESAVGLQTVSVVMRDGSAGPVAARMAPASYFGAARVEVPGVGVVPVEMSYGLNCLEPLVNCADLKLELIPENSAELAMLGRLIRETVVRSKDLPGAGDPALRVGAQLSFYQDQPSGSAVDYRCLAIVGDGEIDTTPSGTSTCAQLAMRFAKGRLAAGKWLTVESITGATLAARVAGTATRAGQPAVIPEISASGRVTRILQILVEVPA